MTRVKKSSRVERQVRWAVAAILIAGAVCLALTFFAAPTRQQLEDRRVRQTIRDLYDSNVQQPARQPMPPGYLDRG